MQEKIQEKLRLEQVIEENQKKIAQQQQQLAEQLVQLEQARKQDEERKRREEEEARRWGSINWHPINLLLLFYALLGILIIWLL